MYAVVWLAVYTSAKDVYKLLNASVYKFWEFDFVFNNVNSTFPIFYFWANFKMLLSFALWF